MVGGTFRSGTKCVQTQAAGKRRPYENRHLEIPTGLRATAHAQPNGWLECDETDWQGVDVNSDVYGFAIAGCRQRIERAPGSEAVMS